MLVSSPPSDVLAAQLVPFYQQQLLQPSQRFGQMRVILTLEDFGSVTTSAQHRVQLQSSENSTASAPSAPSAAQGSDAARANLEYQIAWELEMWKRSEQAAFEARLRDIEQQRMRELEAEFAKADSKRQEQLARKQAELLALELRNKTFFQDLEAQVRGFLSLPWALWGLAVAMDDHSLECC